MLPSTFAGARRYAAGFVAALFLGGCVLSDKPFYSESSVITPLVTDGTWQRLERDGKPKETWVFKGNEVTTTDEDGHSYGFTVTWFQVNGTTFMDTEPLPRTGELPAGEAYWLFHNAPFHMVSRVEVAEDRLRVRPLQFNHFNKATESRPVAPGTIHCDYATIVFDADSAVWADFLARHAADDAVFPADSEIVFVRQ